MSYVCEKSVGAGRSCDFRSGKVILQQPVEREQMAKLLSEGRTALLDGFVSSRTRRRFKAFLVRQPDGKVGFEFQASAPRPGKPGPMPAAGVDGGEGEDGGTAVATPKVTKAAPAKAAAARAAPSKAAPAAKPAAKKPTAGTPATKMAAAKTPAAKKTAARKAPATGVASRTAAPRLRKAG
jgi:DNA topoisomerase-3